MDTEYLHNYDLGNISHFILNQIDDLIVILNPTNDYKIELMNADVFKSTLNYREENLLGKSFLRIVHQTHLQSVIKLFEKGSFLKQSRKNIKILDSEGNIRWFEINTIAFYDNNHNQKKLFVKLKSLSEKKELERKLQEYEIAIKRISKKLPEIHFWKLVSPKSLDDKLYRSYEFLQTILENIPQYICWKDKNLVYLGCNKKYAEFMGVNSFETIIGKTDNELIQDSEKLNFLRNEEREVIRSGSPQFEKIMKWNKNEKEHLLKANRIPLFDLNDNIVGILISYNDLTELMESEQKFREITEQSVMAVIIIQDGLIHYGNQQFEQLFGYKSESFQSWEPFEFLKLVHPDDRDHIKSQTYNRKNGKNNCIHHFQFKGIKKTNQIIWLELYSKRIKYNGRLADLFMLIDITEKKRYQNLITELNINFLNFTTDIQSNIISLLNTSVKLLEGVLALHIFKNKSEENIKIITNQKDIYRFKSLDHFKDQMFVSRFFNEQHDFPQFFIDINESEYVLKDPFMQIYDLKSVYGKLIKTQDKYDECICIFFDKIPRITHDHQLVLFLISAALEIEQKRWEVRNHLKTQNSVLEEMNQFKSDLLTRTSHELKTPLISIKGFRI
ncbi:MAG: hypothetical protein BAJALOKI1v1_1710007 [Promethearchaeota archaeon]|nr:MAG: hypothetical protein BAJALOKI1v1_1710007 [Candidatus Lokiarchaeota archaeon]